MLAVYCFQDRRDAEDSSDFAAWQPHPDEHDVGRCLGQLGFLAVLALQAKRS
jgi:hypothetical protein